MDRVSVLDKIFLEISRSRGDTVEEVLENILADYRTRAFDKEGKQAQCLAAVIVGKMRQLGRWPEGQTLYVLVDGWPSMQMKITTWEDERRVLVEDGWKLIAWSPR